MQLVLYHRGEKPSSKSMYKIHMYYVFSHYKYTESILFDVIFSVDRYFPFQPKKTLRLYNIKENINTSKFNYVVGLGLIAFILFHIFFLSPLGNGIRKKLLS